MTTNELPADLAALLTAHGVPATTDGLIAELKRRNCWLSLSTQCYADEWFAEVRQPEMTCSVIGNGSSLTTALARAFAAVVGSEEEEQR